MFLISLLKMFNLFFPCVNFYIYPAKIRDISARIYCQVFFNLCYFIKRHAEIEHDLEKFRLNRVSKAAPALNATKTVNSEDQEKEVSA
jgi:hypothetical protein